MRWVPFTGFFRERGLLGLSKQFGLWLPCAAGGDVEEDSVEGERSAPDSPAGPSIRSKQEAGREADFPQNAISRSWVSVSPVPRDGLSSDGRDSLLMETQ